MSNKNTELALLLDVKKAFEVKSTAGVGILKKCKIRSSWIALQKRINYLNGVFKA